jgi:hypothetical protein
MADLSALSDDDLIKLYQQVSASPAPASETQWQRDADGNVSGFTKSNLAPKMTDPSTLQIGPMDTGIKIPGGVNDALIRAGRGTADFYQGAKQKALNWAYGNNSPEAKGYTDKVNEENALYDQGHGLDAGFDGWRLAGNVVNPSLLLGGGASTLGRLGMGVLQGGLSSYANFSKDNNALDNLTQAGIGAGLGGALNVGAPYVIDGVVNLASALSNYGKKAVNVATHVPDLVGGGLEAKVAAIYGAAQNGPAATSWQSLAPTVRDQLVSDAKDMLVQNGQLDVNALARKASILGINGKPTTGMVTRSPLDWTQERNLQKRLAQAGTSDGALDPITAALKTNDTALSNQGTRIAYEISPHAPNDYAVGLQAQRTIEGISKASQRSVSDLYGQVRDAVGDQSGIGYDNILHSLDTLKDNAYAHNFHDSVMNRLSSLVGKGQDLTVNKAEELRKFIGTLPDNVSGVDVTGWKSQIRDAIDHDVIGAAGQDFFTGARAAARDRFQMLHDPAIQNLIKSGGSLGEDKNAMTWVNKFVMNGGPGDIAKLRDVLQSQGGQPLWDNIRALVVRNLQDGAIGVDGRFSGANLNKAIDKLGPDRMSSLFSPEELSKLRGWQANAHAMTVEPPYSGVNHSASGTFLSAAENLPWGAGSLARKLNEGNAVNDVLRAVATGAGDAQSKATAKAQATADMIRRWLPSVGPGTLPAGVQNNQR